MVNIPLVDIITEPHPLYHRSSKLYDFPCIKKIDDSRSWSSTHDNSVFGLWASTFPGLYKSFGSYTYEITLKTGTKCKGILFDTFYKISHYEDLISVRNNLKEQCDVLYIVDSSGCVGEVIVLNFDNIEKFFLNTDDLRDKQYELHTPTLPERRYRKDIHQW